MDLKAALAADLAAFFNPSEFGSPSIIDGKPVLVVLDDDSLQEYNFKAEGEGLAIGELLFHATVEAFEDDPFIGKRMMVDKRLYEIIDIKKNMGVYTITLAGYRS